MGQPLSPRAHQGTPPVTAAITSSPLKYVRVVLAKPEQALALWHKALERFELSEQPVAGHQVLALAIATGC